MGKKYRSKIICKSKYKFIYNFPHITPLIMFLPSRCNDRIRNAGDIKLKKWSKTGGGKS